MAAQTILELYGSFLLLLFKGFTALIRPFPLLLTLKGCKLLDLMHSCKCFVWKSHILLNKIWGKVSDQRLNGDWAGLLKQTLIG